MTSTQRRLIRQAPAVGCAFGGILVPLFLFLVCLLLGDLGGPLFWPFIAIVLGLIGLIVGLIIRVRLGRHLAQANSDTPPSDP